MILVESFLIAISTYSVIPVPQSEWNERNMKYALCFFPIVGAFCGAVLWGWAVLAQWLHISSFLFAVTAACLPLLITGGIHMDGFMDTVDALASHQSRERKLEILKDSHCGAFSIMYCFVYLMLFTGLMYELYEADCIFAVIPVFVLSRALSALCAVHLPNARKAGMLQAYTKNAANRIVTMVLAAVATADAGLMILLSPAAGGMSVLFAVGTVLLYRSMARKHFGGVTGDTAGFFLQLCELACLAGAWIGGLVL